MRGNPLSRRNGLGVAGWAVVTDALERVTSLTSLNDCKQYAAIRAGGVKEMQLDGKELGIWVTRFLARSASTLTRLNLWYGGGTPIHLLKYTRFSLIINHRYQSQH